MLAVRVDNAEQPNSRWYSGCGIYRNVWLTKLNPAHIAQWGTYVTAEDVSKNSAQLKIRTKLQYDAEAQMADVVLQSRLVDADGNAVGEAVSGSAVDASYSGRSGAGDTLEESPSLEY